MKQEEWMKRKCESCGMPLTTKTYPDCRGTEVDGSKNDHYCSYCYENGQFTTNSIDDILKYGRAGIKEANDMGTIQKKVLLLFYTKNYLKKLPRWKNQ